jgi:hypothetical protein
VRRRLGRWAVAVGALTVIVAWTTRQRKAADVIRKSYERAREQLSARGQERGQETGEEREGDTTEGNKGYYRKVIQESMERSGLS